jgi:hypothetical protein
VTVGQGAIGAADVARQGAISAAQGVGRESGGGPVEAVTALWCDRCGEAVGEGNHAACAEARRLEPPRFCPACRRRMKVQVVPTGWTAACIEHGITQS